MTEDEQPQQRLERLAQQQLEAVAGSFATCWEVVVFGIHYKMLDADDLQEAKEALERGHGYGSEEIGFEPREEEVSPDIWEKKMQVSYFRETAYCPFEEMMLEMQRLLDAYYPPG